MTGQTDLRNGGGYVEDVEEIVQLAKKLMLETGSHEPVVFLKGSEGKMAVALSRFGDNADKRAHDMLNAGAFTAVKHNVGELELLVFVSEAWMGMNFDIQPSKDPKRVEALIITSLNTGTWEQNMIMFEIVRNHQKQVTDLKQNVLPKYDSIESPLLIAFLKGYQSIRPVTN